MTAELTRVLEIEPDPAFSVRAGGLLAPFTRAGVLTTADVQTAAALLRIEQPYRTALTHADELTRLAAAFCVRSLRHGSVATTMSRLADTESTALAPVVMAIWESRLNAIRETVGYDNVGWEELLQVLNSPNGWQDFGLPDARTQVYYGHTDPYVSSTALSNSTSSTAG